MVKVRGGGGQGPPGLLLPGSSSLALNNRLLRRGTFYLQLEKLRLRQNENSRPAKQWQLRLESGLLTPTGPSFVHLLSPASLLSFRSHWLSACCVRGLVGGPAAAGSARSKAEQPRPVRGR